MTLKKLALSLLAVAFSFGICAQTPTKGLDTKYIAANYFKGVVKILLVDSTLEKQKAGSGYIGRGSGFFVTDDGVIFTNRHVVEYCVKGYIDYDYKDESGTHSSIDAYSDEVIKDPNLVKVYKTGYTTPIVQVYFGKGESDYNLYVAKVLTMGTGSFDGAALKIISDIKGNPVSTKFFPLPIGNSDAAQQGEDLCVYGYPAQYDGNYDIMLKDMSTLTIGKFSGLDYVFNKDYGYIKTDASINGGNSGGPVFNETNKVIGIATAVGNKTGIGLVGGINGMYYVIAPKAEILQKLVAKGLTIPKNAGSISTITGEKLPIKSAEQLGGGGGGNNGGNTTTNNNTTSDAQYSGSRVYAAINLDENTGYLGEEVSAITISPSGSYVWMIVTNKPNSLNTDGLIMDVYHKADGASEYTFYETKEYDLPKSNLLTTYYKYSFYKAGDFKLRVYNKDSKFINEAYVNVEVKGKSGGDGYSGCKVYFTNEILDNGDIGPSYTEFFINKSKGSYVYCVVDCAPSTLATDELIVDIYKKKGSDYKFVETKNYTMSKTTLQTTYFKYSFYEKGEYKFAVYNKNSKWINTGYVTISYDK